MAEAHRAIERFNILGVNGLGNAAESPSEREVTPVGRHGRDARRILPTVLQRLQGQMNLRGHISFAHDSHKSTHINTPDSEINCRAAHAKSQGGREATPRVQPNVMRS